MPEKSNADSMSRYFARVMRALIVSSLGFGGGIGLLTFIAILVNTGKQDALSIALRAGIVIGTGFGVICAIVLLLTDLTARLAIADGDYAEIWELEQTRVLKFEGFLKDARRVSRQALLSVPNIKVVADEDDEYRIKASVGPTWRSPGEQMQIVISQSGDDQWDIQCTSSCLTSNVAFDYGKNFENVENWRKNLKAALAAEGQAVPGVS